MKRAAIYARVSTDDGRQTVTNQTRQLRAYARRMKWKIAAEYCDRISGAVESRPQLDRLMKAATEREFDVVLVWDLSRLTRGGPAAAFQIIERLNAGGVALWSFREEHFRTAGPAGILLIAIAAWIAQEERRTMQERIKAGISRARSSGVRIGRPRRLIPTRPELEKLHAEGKTIRELATTFKVGKSTIERRLAG
jgi:DNA invertase Pin-like site-specific DNA recombinase